MKVDAYFLSPEARETIAAKVKAQRADLDAKRRLRATAGSLTAASPPDRRSANDRRNGGERRMQDRRGAWTVEVDGQIVIQPAKTEGADHGL